VTRRQRGDLETLILLLVIFITCSVSLRSEDLHDEAPGAEVSP